MQHTFSRPSLKQLVSRLPGAVGLPEKDTMIEGITSDSRQVKPGWIYVAIHGTSQDGNFYIPQAREAGAAWIVSDQSSAPADTLVHDARLALSLMACRFYGNPSHSMKVIGITGTSGKTTTSFLLESILAASGLKTGLIGTVEFRLGGEVLPSTHTTPGPVELQALLRRMRDAGCEALVLEVSSHALKQHRSAGMLFDAMIFTGLSPEHLDYHPDMEDYFASKSMLFVEYADASAHAGKDPVALVNQDDSWGRKLLQTLRSRAAPDGRPRRIRGFGLDPAADCTGAGLSIGIDGVSGRVDGVEVHSSLIGSFNASNLLAAVSCATALGISASAIETGLRVLKGVPGRLEPVPNPRGIHILVDYAHKSDALEKVLKVLGGMKGEGKLITVFGCGGDRDRGKRPVMGALAARLSDRVVITTDNPRTEDPDTIIDEILGGTSGYANFIVESDRREAIRKAVTAAKPGDIVLIAGKGHENYQIIGDKKFPFDDREAARDALD